jgi:hypothetical protein
LWVIPISTALLLAADVLAAKLVLAAVLVLGVPDIAKKVPV